MVADFDPSRGCNIPIPYVRKSSTVKILGTHTPQAGSSFLGTKKVKPDIAQPQQGMFTPVPIAPLIMKLGICINPAFELRCC